MREEAEKRVTITGDCEIYLTRRERALTEDTRRVEVTAFSFTTMITEKIKELKLARARFAELQARHAEELNEVLATLPAKYKFASTAAFARAVLIATGEAPVRRKRRTKVAARPVGARTKTRAIKRRRR